MVPWFWIGLLLNISSWAISWLQFKPFSYFTFAGIWIGFILILDGINYKIKGSSMLTRNRLGFFLTFLISSGFWWVFELLVMITKNWYYITDRNIISVSEHQLLGSLYFSTVIPAFLEISEILINKNIFSKDIKFFKYPKKLIILFPIIGVLSFIAIFIRPDFFFGLLWIFLYLIFDYINYKLGFDNLIKDILENQWKRVVILAIAALICGFFWEMWNSYADPKWVYEVPYLGVLKIFEMPVLGFLGYLPFGLEVFAFFSLFQGLLKYPKEKFFEITQNRFAANKQPVKPVLITIFVLLFTISIFGILENNLFTDFSAKQKFAVEPLSQVLNKNTVSELIHGNIDFCYLGIIPSKCLVTPDRQTYLLVNSKGEAVNVDNTEAIVTGQLYNQQNVLGMRQLIPSHIYVWDQ